MIGYIVNIVIVIILVFVSVIAIKAINRGIESKKNLDKNYDHDKHQNNKNSNDKK